MDPLSLFFVARSLYSWIRFLCLSGSLTAWNVNCLRRQHNFPQQQPQGRQRGQRPSEDPQADGRGEAEGAAPQRKSFRHKAVRSRTAGLQKLLLFSLH